MKNVIMTHVHVFVPFQNAKRDSLHASASEEPLSQSQVAILNGVQPQCSDNMLKEKSSCHSFQSDCCSELSCFGLS